jgi:CBS domain containing-hemolysin-like protein
VTLTYALVGIVLLIANGFFVGAEFALMAARRTRIEELAEAGDRRAATALASIRELSLMLAGAQLGITMASLGLGFVAEPAIADLLETAISNVVEIPEGLLHSISFTLGLSIIVFLHMVIGEMAPKNIAIARPDAAALWLAVPMRMYVNLFRPVIWLLNALANAGLRLLRVEPVDEVASVYTADEINQMISESAQGGLLGRFEEQLLSGAIELGERDAASAMIPRTEMVAISLSVTPSQIESLVVESGHTRFPVYRDDLDEISGFIHSKDLLRVADHRRDQPLEARLVRRMLVVPESRKLRPLLVDMRRERSHMALVIDEHGGTAGIVTLEDVLEELVGEIRDEYDTGELRVEPLGDGRYLVPGNLRIDETESYLGVELPEGEYETLSGFLMDRLGRIPRRRDVVEHNGWRLRVHNMHRRRVVQVLIEPAGNEQQPG